MITLRLPSLPGNLLGLLCLHLIHTHHLRRKCLNIRLLLDPYSHSDLGLLSHLRFLCHSLPGSFTLFTSLTKHVPLQIWSNHTTFLPLLADLFQKNWFSFSLTKRWLSLSIFRTSVRMLGQSSDHGIPMFILWEEWCVYFIHSCVGRYHTEYSVFLFVSILRL